MEVKESFIFRMVGRLSYIDYKTAKDIHNRNKKFVNLDNEILKLFTLDGNYEKEIDFKMRKQQHRIDTQIEYLSKILAEYLELKEHYTVEAQKNRAERDKKIKESIAETDRLWREYAKTIQD